MPPWRASSNKLNQFQIAGLDVGLPLGSGGSGDVFAGRRQCDGRALAVKVGHRRGDPRFAREREALLSLGPPHTPEFLGSGATSDGRPYLLMELLAGESLGDCLRRQPVLPIPVHETVALVGRVASLIDHIHQAGLVHRDIKPDNIWLRDSGQPCLVDFGLAHTETAAPLTRAGVAVGSVLYMAPEQIAGDPTTGRAADHYALAAIAYLLVAGRPPFSGTAAEVRHAHRSLRPSPIGCDELSRGLHKVLLRGLTKDPARRFPNGAGLATALADAVAAAFAGTELATAPESAALRPSPRGLDAKRRRVALLYLDGIHDPASALLAARAEGGTAARLGRRSCVLAFPRSDTLSGLLAARRAAHSMRNVKRAIIDVGELAVRDCERGILLAGTALDQTPCDDDLVSQTHSTYLTPRVASILGVDHRSHTFGFPTPPSSTPLRGRDIEIARCLGAAKAALSHERGAALTTAICPEGMGGSRLLEAVAETLHCEANVVQLDRAGADYDPDWLARGLLRSCLELGTGRIEPDSIRAALNNASGWPAAALTLGAMADDDPRVSALRSSPNALRHALARATATAIVQRAHRRPLALLVDGGHVAGHAALDAIELATMSDAPLWVLMIAGPCLRATRTHWGSRARFADELALCPLDDNSARSLLLDRLQPATDVPDSVLNQLAEMCRGVPARIDELTLALRLRGAIRQHRGSAGWYLATDLLFEATPSPVSVQLADELREQLPSSTWSVAGVCAVLGGTFHVDEVDLVMRTLDDKAIDPWLAITHLTKLQILEPVGAKRLRFSNAMLRTAIEGALSPYVRHQIHSGALAALRKRRAPPARLARHASGCGARSAAFEYHRACARQNEQRHRYLAAETHYTEALGQLHGNDERATSLRARVLAGRGRVRYRVQRHSDALDDLRSARRLAEHRQDDHMVAELLLEEAVVLHWCYDFAGDAALVGRAASLIRHVQDRRLHNRWLMARGRSLFYAQRLTAAIEALTRAATTAQHQGDTETRVLSLTLLSYVLVLEGAPFHAAEARFAELIELCTTVGDRFHLGVAYMNRVNLWIERQDSARALRDAARAGDIARELGNLMLERTAIYNSAEVHYYTGQLDRAEALARRCREIQEMVYERPGPEETLLLARIAARRGRSNDARAHLNWLTHKCPRDTRRPTHDLLIEMVELSVDDAPKSKWDDLLDRARRVELIAAERRDLIAFATRHVEPISADTAEVARSTCAPTGTR